MNKETEVLNLIKSIRESFGSSISTYTMGNCYQFYEILKTVFIGAVAYESGGHIYTKINNEFYDIKGKNTNKHLRFILVKDDRIKSFTVNKWSDERRKLFELEYKKLLIKKITKGDEKPISIEGDKIIIREYKNK